MSAPSYARRVLALYRQLSRHAETADLHRRKMQQAEAEMRRLRETLAELEARAT